MTNSRCRVLIVDDELFFREAIGEVLSGAGFQIGVAEDGQSALASAEDDSFGAVVLDVRLPDLDGIQVLARIREMRPDLPIIMLSSSTDQAIVLEALRLGATDYLAKPLHDEELILAVGRALDSHEISAERARLQGRIDRLVASMERLSQLVRLASPQQRVPVLRQGIVDAARDVLRTSRVSLLLADPEQELLSVVAACGVDAEVDSMSPRKVGEGASGVCYAEGSVLCVADGARDGRFSWPSVGVYESSAFAIVPLVCLGVPVGVLCVTHGEGDGDLFLEEPNILRLLGMQVSEFLAADPDVEGVLSAAAVVDVEGVDADRTESVTGGVVASATAMFDGDLELARLICDAVAAETDPKRMLARALAAVSRQLRAESVSLYLLSSDGVNLELEMESDGSLVNDRESIAANKGLVGVATQSGQLVAVARPDDDARFMRDLDTASDEKSRPYLCLPLKLRDKVIGILRVFLEPDAPASPRTGEILAATFSAALRNVLLYRSLLQSVDEVARARRDAKS